MRYFIRGKLARTQEILAMKHEEFLDLLRSKVGPSIKMLLAKDNPHGTVLCGGTPAGGKDVLLMVDLSGRDSHAPVRRFLMSLPIFDYYEWEATPLESLEELVISHGG